MKKRYYYYLSIAIFFLFIFGIPICGLMSRIFNCQNSERQKATLMDDENRVLAEFPTLSSVDDFFQFPDAFQTWFSDHLFFKQEMVSLKTVLDIALFGELDSDQVILGKKKPWLFNQSDDGQPLDTYKHTNRFLKEKLEAMGENLASLQSDLNDAGIRFVLMVSPDKEQIYGEDYMPGWVRVQEEEIRTLQFIKYMEENYPQIKIVYPAIPLREEKVREEAGGRSVYYESDTHWNRIGACVASRALLGAILEGSDWGNEGGEPDFNTYSSSLYEFVDNGRKRGDLQRLVQLGSDYDSTEYDPIQEPMYTVIDSMRDQNNEVIRELSKNDSESCLPIRLYLSGDSFRWNLGRFIEDAVSESVIASRYYLDLDDLAEFEPDIFIYMIAERYLQELDLLPGYNTMALVP